VTRERCFVPECDEDADCTAGENGRCALLSWNPSQAGIPSFAGVKCVYDSCGGPFECDGAVSVLGIDRFYACPCA
jgi:hypothetical protein